MKINRAGRKPHLIKHKRQRGLDKKLYWSIEEQRKVLFGKQSSDSICLGNFWFLWFCHYRGSFGGFDKWGNHFIQSDPYVKRQNFGIISKYRFNRNKFFWRTDKLFTFKMTQFLWWHNIQCSWCLWQWNPWNVSKNEIKHISNNNHLLKFINYETWHGYMKQIILMESEIFVDELQWNSMIRKVLWCSMHE